MYNYEMYVFIAGYIILALGIIFKRIGKIKYLNPILFILISAYTLGYFSDLYYYSGDYYTYICGEEDYNGFKIFSQILLSVLIKYIIFCSLYISILLYSNKKAHA